MDFPYAVIMTTYAGQTPEAVETTVSKPLEQSMSAIDGVKEITSTSSDNYSLLMIEFEDGTNMDSATVDMRSSLDTIKGNCLTESEHRTHQNQSEHPPRCNDGG